MFLELLLNVINDHILTDSNSDDLTALINNAQTEYEYLSVVLQALEEFNAPPGYSPEDDFSVCLHPIESTHKYSTLERELEYLNRYMMLYKAVEADRLFYRILAGEDFRSKDPLTIYLQDVDTMLDEVSLSLEGEEDVNLSD